MFFIVRKVPYLNGTVAYEELTYKKKIAKKTVC